MGDAVTVVLPLLPVGVAFAVAGRFEQRIPTRLRVYRFHAIMYPVVAILGLVAAKLMGVSPSVDWWMNDATIYLELIFGSVGVVLCLILAPAVLWLERRSAMTTIWRSGRVAVTLVTLIPYMLTAGILLFYRE